MKKIFQTFIAVTLVSISAASAQSTIFKTINSAEMNLGWLSAFELPINGGALYSGNSSPIADLNAVYTTSETVVFSPNTINDPSPVWYTPSGQVGATGNKIMEAYLYGQSTGVINGQTLVFEGMVTDFGLSTNAAGLPYSLTAYIKDIAPDYSSAVETSIPITSNGSFQINLTTLSDPARHVQWGLIMQGPNIWPGDTEQLEIAGSATIQAIPEPSTYALLGLAAAGGLLVRRFRRKA